MSEHIVRTHEDDIKHLESFHNILKILRSLLFRDECNSILATRDTFVYIKSRKMGTLGIENGKIILCSCV